MNDSQVDLEQRVAWRDCPQSPQELRAEIDRLRLRNQELHIALLRAEQLGPHLRHAAAETIAQGRNLVRRAINRLKNGGPAPHEPSAFPQFAPYEVNVPPAHDAMRPRILHFIANFYTGGSAQLVVDLVERLAQRFHQEVVSRDLPASPSYTNLHLHHYPSFTGAAQALSLLQRYNPHIVHIHYLGHHNSEYSELDWRWYHHIFEAVEQHGAIVVENLNIPVEPYISPAVRCYVHVSDYVKCHFGRLDSLNTTIYPGSDLQLFSRQAASPVPDDCIGMVCRLEQDKLSPQSIDVLIDVVRRRPGTTAIVVGGGTLLAHYQECVTQAHLQHAFTFTGYASYSKLPSLYEQMSVFISPVHTESFGQVSAFAMGMELPVAAYNVGALPEIVDNSALLAPPGESENLATIIIDLLDNRDKRLAIGRANRLRAEEHFSVEAMIEQYAGLYESLLG